MSSCVYFNFNQVVYSNESFFNFRSRFVPLGISTKKGITVLWFINKNISEGIFIDSIEALTHDALKLFNMFIYYDDFY